MEGQEEGNLSKRAGVSGGEERSEVEGGNQTWKGAS